MNKYILLLLSIVLCLISIYLFNNKNTSTIEDDNNFSVSDTSTIQKIFIADRSGTTIHLDRNEKNWIVNEKYQVRKEAINLLLSTINKLEIERPVPLTSLERVIKDLATTGVRIEIYDNSDCIKAYTIGNTTSNHSGNYMLLDKAKTPYILHIPDFNGFLSPRYGIQGQLINEENWRSHKVFNLQASEINNISLYNYNSIEQSFNIKFNPLRLENISGDIIKYNQKRMRKYINSFSKINCESYKPNKNDIFSKKPIHTLIVNKDTLTIYPIKDSIFNDKKENYNVKRMYATLNNNDVMLIQEYVFNKLLITLDELSD